MEQQSDTIYSALARAQATFATVRKTHTVTVKSQKGNYKYKYADLEATLAAVRPSLNREGIYLSQPVAFESGRLVCRTVLYYRDASLSAGEVSLPAPSDAQALGSAITYARRYCLCAALAIAADDDDDGAAAQTAGQPAAPTAPPPAPTVTDAVRAAGEAAAAAGWKAFAAWWNHLPGTDRDACNLAGLTDHLKETAKAATIAQRAAATEIFLAAQAEEESHV